MLPTFRDTFLTLEGAISANADLGASVCVGLQCGRIPAVHALMAVNDCFPL